MKRCTRRLSVLAGLMFALDGCYAGLVGTTFVSAPGRLPSHETLPPLTEPLTFDMCPASNRALGDAVRKAFAQVGVPAELTPVPGTPVSLTVSLRTVGHSDFDQWMLAPLLTASIIPGYFAERRAVEVRLAWNEATSGAHEERLEYQARKTTVFWLPLLVYPDILFTPDKGWESARSRDGGLTRVIERVGDDIRARVSRGAKVTVGVACDPGGANQGRPPGRHSHGLVRFATPTAPRW